MKVVLLSFLYEPKLGGGAAVVVHQLARLLLERSHTVVVITSWKGRGVKTEYIDGIKIIRIPPMNLYWVGDKDSQKTPCKVAWQLVDLWNPLVYRLVRHILINESADVVHSHKLRGLSPSIWSAAASAGVKKIVHTCHDFELLSPEGLFMGKIGRLAQEQNIFMRPYQILRRNFSRLVLFAIAPSRFVMDYHEKMGFFPLARTRIVPHSHGFGANALMKNNPDLLMNSKKDLGKRFLYVGRLDKAKGIDLLCQAFLKVAGQRQDFKLRITGWGCLENTLREQYKQQKNIEFTGGLFGDQKAELFRGSDVLVAPSVAPESFGLVICEAYSHGLPVIASRVGAYSEIVREGETGLLVNPGSVDDLFSALVKVSQGHILNAMSANCFEEARKYTTENFINNYLAIYEDGS